jgi:uncharacterized membrane protein YkvA (DUF1232 family)
MQQWKQQAKQLKQEIYAIYLAGKDRRVPWYARLLGAIVVAYALCPIDLIPDAIPILGYLDDLILVPLGIVLVLRLIPPVVLQEYRTQAAIAESQAIFSSQIAAVVIMTIWVLLGILAIVWLKQIMVAKAQQRTDLVKYVVLLAAHFLKSDMIFYKGSVDLGLLTQRQQS